MNETIDANETKREELLERHRLEKKQLNEPVDRLTDQLSAVKVDTIASDLSQDTEVIANGIKYNETKISKAQKRRDAKALKEKQRQQQIIDDTIDDSENERLIEAEKLKNILVSRGLVMHDIASDGDCMYRSIVHQLSLQNITTDVSELRQKTCDYMMDNKIDFIPFLTSNTTGDMMSDSEYENYCNDIATTKSWGGQLELRAICHIFRVAIEVIQSVGNSVLIGHNDSNTDRPLILCYLRYAYSLGEHYNSVRNK
ncbi:unnamed protein product [Medioppia subpectinata]|uniref:ubiquitinyl hydrolase 1 n=1 Tax=Medioppia subpectinata TaxID=1979941 RepID=A0A7R9PUY3_9ACAR|nr:unnamed protein product [Medioppia subpectinata]CAG2101721.1 unnamed protein product [Medioppia subpectinata]